MRRLLSLFVLLVTALSMRGQIVVSGIVTDAGTGLPLPHVSVRSEDSDVRTVTNEDGRFTLKTTAVPRYIQLSHIGYKTCRHSLANGSTENLKLTLSASTVRLDEVVVSLNDPALIVEAAMRRIEQNYAHEPELVRCFYRETARRGSRFISVAEAVTDMYKSDYHRGPDYDAVAILKGRRLMSMKSSDTLGVKIQGGPVLPLMVDVAKNPDYLLNQEMLNHCTLKLELPTKLGDRLHYVVRVIPRSDVLTPMMGGLLFVDQQTLAFTRAELQLDMSDWRKASDYMLVYKPLGMRFRPKELSVTVVYETDREGVTRMSYVRNEMRFNCDWKRKMFSSPFTTVSEMVVTDRLVSGREARHPSGRSSFGLKDRFYDRVEYFEDRNFWADYNIIEPTESLEKAIGKLKKRQ